MNTMEKMESVNGENKRTKRRHWDQIEGVTFKRRLKGCAGMR